MTRINNSVVSTMQSQPQRFAWARIGFVAAMLAFCPAFLPSALADCGGPNALGRSLAIRPGSFAPALVSANPSAASATANASNSSATIVGLWNLNFISGGQIVDVAFDAWHSDGTEVLNDYTNPINGNVCLGVWTQTGPGAYKLKHPSWYFDGAGNLLGTVVIHENVRLGASGNTFTGTYVDDVYDTAGNLLVEYSGTLQATRIVAN
jgi:hypothetical protein